MRLAAGVLALALIAPVARAQDTTSPEPARPAGDSAHARLPFRVVRVMPESRQALLFDRRRATHVLAEIGGKLEGYTVEDIDDETVTLRRDGQEIVLAAPPRGAGRRERAAAARAPAASVPETGEPAPIDPYGDPVRSIEAPGADRAPAPDRTPGPGDSLPPSAGVRVARAPSTSAAPPPAAAVIAPGDGGVRVAEAPDPGPAGDASSATGAARSIPDRAPAPGPHAGPPAATGPHGASSTGPAPSPGAGPDASSAPAAGAGAIRGVEAPDAGSAVRAPAVSKGSLPAVASDGAAGGAAPSQDARPSPAIDRPVIDRPAPLAPPAAETAPEIRAASGRPADRRTLDARALADVMTSDHAARSPRGPAGVPGAPTRAAEVRPPAPAATTPAEARPGDASVISRGELDGALSDFAALTAAVRGSFTATGVAVEGVADGSVFQRAGLRAGDVVTEVDGIRLRTLDDAAELYARASSAKAITAQLVRAGKPVTLHVVIR